MSQRRAYPLTRLSLLVAEKHLIHDMVVAVGRFCSRAEKAEIIRNIRTAFDLIQEYAPVRLKAMQGDVQTVFVHGLIEFPGWYVPKQRLVELNVRDVLGPQGGPEWLACILIHEAQHARLFRLGFGYDQRIRARIEALCYRAERIFAHALPNGRELAAEAQSFLDRDLDYAHSSEGHFHARMRALRHEGCPEWLVRIVEWIARRRGLIS